MEWLAEAQEALARLDGTAWAEKKKATIIALVDARLAGRPEESIWNRPEVCARNTYHSKWKRDPLFAEVLAEVDRLAKAHRDGRALRALQQAAERLALASPVAVGKLVERLNSTDENIILRAAVAILDRADFSTAAKSSALTGEMDGLLDDAEQAAVEAALREQASRDDEG